MDVVVCQQCGLEHFLDQLYEERRNRCDGCGAGLPLSKPVTVESETPEVPPELAEADFLGRMMAHAYVTELTAITGKVLED